MDNSPQPISPKPCPECGGERVSAQGGRYMSMAYKRKASSPTIMFGGFPNLGLDAWVCTNCGYTAFYVRDPSAFKE